MSVRSYCALLSLACSINLYSANIDMMANLASFAEKAAAWGTTILGFVDSDITGKCAEAKKEAAAVREMIDALRSDPVGFLNNFVYSKFECECDAKDEYKEVIAAGLATSCKTDEATGIHYKQYGNLNSKNYVFFFHGMMYDIEYPFSGVNNRGVLEKIKESGFNIVVVEYNLFKKDGQEMTYGFGQISEMSNHTL